MQRSSYYLTQFITGHGDFQSYLFCIGKAPTDICAVICVTMKAIISTYTYSRNASLAFTRTPAWAELNETGDKNY